MRTTYKNREVEIELEIEGYNGEDSYFSSGGYTDGLEEDLTEDELEELNNDCRDLIADYVFEAKIGAAEAFYEGDR
jgi:hypothetical protein